MQICNRRGQNLAEYAILFGLVIGAFLTIQVYAKRGIQARIKSGTDALTSVNATIQSTNDSSLTQPNFQSQSQYEPYYAESTGKTYQENVKQQHMGGGGITEEIVSDVSARASGAEQKQKGATGRATADNLWTGTQ